MQEGLLVLVRQVIAQIIAIIIGMDAEVVLEHAVDVMEAVLLVHHLMEVMGQVQVEMVVPGILEREMVVLVPVGVNFMEAVGVADMLIRAMGVVAQGVL